MGNFKEKFSNGMKTFGSKSKSAFFKTAEFLGFKKSSAYVSSYIHRANIRSGIFMAIVIAAIEVWMIIRQSIERVKPMIETEIAAGRDYSFFKIFYGQTSNFWMFLFLGISMAIYCVYSLRKKKTKNFLISLIAIAALGLLLFAFIDYQSNIIDSLKSSSLKSRVYASFLLVFYIAIFLFQCSIILATIYQYRGGKSEWINHVIVIILFALTCLSFGMMVSYSDYFAYAKDPVTGANLTEIIYDQFGNPSTVRVIAYKQIICFLMMTLYVGCLLIWKPYISLGILGVVFLGFHHVLVHLQGLNRSVQDGDVVNYITFFISLVMVCFSIYSQRVAEAKKDEELEILATQDKLTGLLSFEYFCKLCEEKIDEENPKDREYIYLFYDITSFKILNEQRGFEAGNETLRKIGEILKSVYPDQLITRQGDDHFVIFAKNENIEESVNLAEQKVKELDTDIRPGVKVGGYLYFSERKDPHSSVEKARYAFSTLKSMGGHANYLRYDHNMSNKYKLVQYIASHIDEAVAKNWIVAYYQPVVYSKDRKLCGVEALARWIDPENGFLSPGIFIPALEDAQLAYKLDLAMLELVCKNMRRVLDKKETIVPTSINFSRSDFSIVDIPSEIVRITDKYQIPTEYLHIEITESALLEKHVDLADAMRRIKENGFSIWLDDFGSGYSSFNTLKDYDFDVLKLDMEFLKGFESNKKSKPLIKAVIEMANHVNMRTLAEGVETEEQAAFLKSIGCEKLQGYLISKPISYEDLNDGIAQGKFVISKDLN